MYFVLIFVFYIIFDLLFCLKGGSIMKFIPKSSEKIAISCRIEKDYLDLIDKYSNENNISRNEFINQCLEFALSNLDENTSK